MKIGLAYNSQLATAMAASNTATTSSSSVNSGAEAVAQPDRVTLSRIGLDKSKQAQAKQAEQPSDPLEAAIEKLKERIEEIKEELRKLQSDDSEAGEQRRRLLQTELQQLSQALLQLMEKQLEGQA